MASRLLDYVFVSFFITALLICAIFDYEQVAIDPVVFAANPDAYSWPPRPAIEAIHWWGNTADPLLMNRPTWFKAGIWSEIIVQVPYYFFAIYAFIAKKEWIRIPTVIYSVNVITLVCVILVEQFYGTFVSPRPDLIIAAYGSYLIMPLLLLIRALPSRMFDTGVLKITETGAETKKSK